MAVKAGTVAVGRSTPEGASTTENPEVSTTAIASVLGLDATQESTLGLIFHWADRNGLPLLDLADLRQVIRHLTSDEGRDALGADRADGEAHSFQRGRRGLLHAAPTTSAKR